MGMNIARFLRTERGGSGGWRVNAAYAGRILTWNLSEGAYPVFLGPRRSHWDEEERDYGTFYPDVRLVRILLAVGARVDVVTRAGCGFTADQQTAPLHVAALEGHLELAKLLLAAGANASQKVKSYYNEAGTTALSFFMSRLMANYSRRLFCAEAIHVALYLLANGADVVASQRGFAHDHEGDLPSYRETIEGARRNLRILDEGDEEEYESSDSDSEGGYRSDGWRRWDSAARHFPRDFRYDPKPRQDAFRELDRLEAALRPPLEEADMWLW